MQGETGPPRAVHRSSGCTHFIGIGGIGMSGLSQLLRWEGQEVSGSDREHDKGSEKEFFEKLKALGIKLHPQDGSGVGAGTSRVVFSTAVEEDNPDLVAAVRLGKPALHRSELLASLFNCRCGIAVTGSSGKSTVAALIGHVLTECGCGPTMLVGAELLSLQREGLIGNAHCGTSDIMVIEADESDGTLTRYSPRIGVLTNVGRDHREPEELGKLFQEFASNTSETLILNADCPGLRGMAIRHPHVVTYSLNEPATVRPSRLVASDTGKGMSGCMRFELDGCEFTSPMPGIHNVANSLAAIAAAREMGLDDRAIAAALGSFAGLKRRLELVGEANGIKVIDDYAHSPAKIRAALEAVKTQGGSVIAVYQPHGYGPTKFYKEELLKTFRECLMPGDQAYLLDIYDAGGTADRTVLATDLEIPGLARHAPSREALVAEISRIARRGDTVLIMGARDRSLPQLARTILASL